MAKLEKNLIDTRSFPDICSALTDQEWLELRRKILTRTGVTKQTILNWKSGDTIPPSPIVRNEIVKIVNRHLNIKTIPQTLFAE